MPPLKSVYDLVGRLRRELARKVPAAWTPHWMRHSHATALMAGVPVHVVSRRLGHADVQTTLDLYAHVTEAADMWSVAEWQAFTARVAGDGGDRRAGRAVPVNGVRQLMLDFLGHVRASRAGRGPTAGQPVSAAHAKTILVNVEQFCLFMHDHKDAAAASAGEPGWAELGARHAGFYRNRELPRQGRRDPRDKLTRGVRIMFILLAIVGVVLWLVTAGALLHWVNHATRHG